jgi:hypothetical protein
MTRETEACRSRDRAAGAPVTTSLLMLNPLTSRRTLPLSPLATADVQSAVWVVEDDKEERDGLSRY